MYVIVFKKLTLSNLEEYEQYSGTSSVCVVTQMNLPMTPIYYFFFSHRRNSSHGDTQGPHFSLYISPDIYSVGDASTPRRNLMKNVQYCVF